jgi:hypothetical protein
VLLLVSSVVEDGGRHISVHLTEQDDQALILALSHQAQPGDLQDLVLPRLHELGAVSCGTEITPDGRQVWAVLDCAVCADVGDVLILARPHWEPRPTTCSTAPAATTSTGHARAVASDVRRGADQLPTDSGPQALADIVLGEAEGRLFTTIEGTLRRVQKRVRRVRATGM